MVYGGRDPARYARGCFQLYDALSLKEKPLRTKAVEVEWAVLDRSRTKLLTENPACWQLVVPVIHSPLLDPPLLGAASGADKSHPQFMTVPNSFMALSPRMAAPIGKHSSSISNLGSWCRRVSPSISQPKINMAPGAFCRK